MEFQSQDPNFSVSWLLGLRPYPTRPVWAGLYETTDPHFRVSRILGLIPSYKPRKSRKKPKATPETVKPEQDEESEEEADFGLRRLFRDGTDEDDVEEGSEESSDSEQTNSESESDPPVLAEPGFLALCKQMEQLLDDIEYASLMIIHAMMLIVIGNQGEKTSTMIMSPSMAYRPKIARTNPHPE